MTNIIAREELLCLNEMMLGRGMPVQEDGVGYNKADYGACSTYFYGLSDAQYADLAKRLTKYCKTQLGLDKDLMKETHQYYAEIAGHGDRSTGVSLNVTENGTLISFRYNEMFIDVIKALPRRQYDRDNKQWLVPNEDVLIALSALEEYGADVKNAVEYAKNHELIKQCKAERIEVLEKHRGDDEVLLKFKYNADVLEKIKEIEFKDRKWNAEFKYWVVKPCHLENLKQSLQDVAVFKQI